jgi:hypothetical protein
MARASADLMREMDAHGFDYVQTGGGCDAFMRFGQDGTIVIVAAEDCQVPMRWNEPVEVTIHPRGAEYEGPLAMFMFGSVREVWRVLVYTDGLRRRSK